MEDATNWDYSKIPERKWTWHFEEDHWMDCVVNSVGVNYYGTDWTCQSGGGYFGGFQTYEEFLSEKPLQQMPVGIAKEIREHLEEYRKQGGSTLRLVHIYNIEGFLLRGVSVELDENPIHIKRVKKEGEMLLYNGSISSGEHRLGFHFVFRSRNDMKVTKGNVTIKIQEGTNQAVLSTTVDKKGNLRTELK